MGWWFWGGVLLGGPAISFALALVGFNWSTMIRNATAGLTGGGIIKSNHVTRYANNNRMRYGGY